MRIAPALLVLFTAPALGDESESAAAAEGLPIGTITIERQNIFDTSKDAENNWLYRLVNRLHIVTRETVIAKQLLFDEGEYYS